MTTKELDYQYALARLYIETCYLDSTISADEYIATAVALEVWHSAGRISPDTACPINIEPVRRAMFDKGMGNVEPFAVRP